MSADATKNQVNYIAMGDGYPVVLVHGLAASLYDWANLMPALAEAGFRAYALDLLGHGESRKPDEPENYNAENLYGHFARWVKELSLADPPLLVGHSLGGYISLRYALEDAGGIAGLVLVDPFYSPDQLMPALRFLNRRPDLGEKALRYAPLWLIHLAVHFDLIDAITFPKETRRQIAVDYKRASPHVLYIPRSLLDLTYKVQEIPQPALVIWGEKDRTLEPSSFSRLLDLMPNASGYPLSDCGHQPHISRPSDVSQIILEFMLARFQAEIPD